MARLPRIVLPGIPHHLTQRGNRREKVFFEDGDYELYFDLLADAAGRAGVEIWSYCLMPNHVHIFAVPRDADGLSRAFRFVHRHYTGYINARMRVTGHLWQGRFSSVAMDEPHFVAALRYVALNPVRARLTERAEDWRWSSTRRISPVRTITSSPSPRRSNASAISLPFWAMGVAPTRMAWFG